MEVFNKLALFSISGNCRSGGHYFLKLSQGLTKLVPSILMFILYGLSIVGLAFAVKEIEVSVAYAV